MTGFLWLFVMAVVACIAESTYAALEMAAELLAG